MRHEVPIQTLSGSPAPLPLVLDVEGTLIHIGLSSEHVGRDVEEELELSAFEDLLAGGPRRNHDLLGLTFETDGGETVLWTVSVGSGNERFLTRRDDLARALGM